MKVLQLEKAYQIKFFFNFPFYGIWGGGGGWIVAKVSHPYDLPLRFVWDSFSTFVKKSLGHVWAVMNGRGFLCSGRLVTAHSETKPIKSPASWAPFNHIR